MRYDWYTFDVVGKTVFELLILVLAVYVAGWVGSYLPPTYTDNLLASGTDQVGWPLAHSAQSDQEIGWEGSGPHTFNLNAFLVDLLIFYIPLRLAAYALRRRIIPLIQKYDSNTYVERYWPYVRYSLLGLVGIIIMYYVVVPSLTYKPGPFYIGVDPENALTPTPALDAASP